MSGLARFSSLFLLASSLLGLCGAPSAAQRTNKGDDAAERHRSADWLVLAPHLAEVSTGSAVELERDADVLRARRFDEDSLVYYQAALAHGGDAARLYNRIGMTELALRNPMAARLWFARLVALERKDANGWNNLGAAEFFLQNYQAALHDYLRAVKLQRSNAVFHANLATSYFGLKQYENAQKQFAAAFRLDPAIFQPHEGSGIEARVLTETDRGRFCFTLAEVAARQGDQETMLRWLTQASEAGFNLRDGMSGKSVFDPWLQDPRIKQIEENARLLRRGRTVATAPIPALPGGPAK